MWLSEDSWNSEIYMDFSSLGLFGVWWWSMNFRECALIKWLVSWERQAIFSHSRDVLVQQGYHIQHLVVFPGHSVANPLKSKSYVMTQASYLMRGLGDFDTTTVQNWSRMLEIPFIFYYIYLWVCVCTCLYVFVCARTHVPVVHGMVCLWRSESNLQALLLSFCHVGLKDGA